MVKLSVLDQSAAISGGSQSAAVRETIDLARHVERLGYHRYWLAEHHSAGAFSSAAPEIMTAAVAAATKSIRVGPGGVLLSHYSPFKVAEAFRVLSALYPGRIDLGIGRAPGGTGTAVQALQPSLARYDDNTFPAKVVALKAFLSGAAVDGYPDLHAVPDDAEAPELWLLGSGSGSAGLAAQLGCAFASAHFINSQGAAGVMEAYRQAFRPSPTLDRPLGNVCFFVLCADTEEEARDIEATRDLWRLRLGLGIRAAIPTVEEALAYDYSDAEQRYVETNRARHIAGTPEQVRDWLLRQGKTYEADEFVILTNCASKARFRSYELLAEAFELDRTKEPAKP